MIEEVRENATKVSTGVVSELQHIERVYKITQRNEVDLGLPMEVLTKLQEAGFTWLVKPDFIQKFKYAASINKALPSVKAFLYVGDFPDHALNNIEKAKDAGIQHFSIHSTQPFPSTFIKTDPVIIGWFKNPEIWQRSEIFTTNCRYLGVVVAIWDADKEIVL